MRALKVVCWASTFILSSGVWGQTLTDDLQTGMLHDIAPSSSATSVATPVMDNPYAGVYSGVFIPTKVKRGYLTDAGPITVTVTQSGTVTGQFSNHYGSGILTGAVSAKGKLIAYTVDSSGAQGSLKGTLKVGGTMTLKATTQYAKFMVTGKKS